MRPYTTRTLAGSSLTIPAEPAMGAARKSVRRWVSVTGDLDPIGGHFVRRQAPWAYMRVEDADAISLVDRQTLVGTGNERLDLLALLRSALRPDGPPAVTPENPHSWLGYVERHREDLRTWFA